MQVRTGVITGVLVLALAAVGSLIVGLVSDLTFGDVLLYIGLPVLVLGAAVLTVFSARWAVQTTRQLARSQELTSKSVGLLANQVRRLQLADVIHAAHTRGWEVNDRDDDLVFASPDDDELWVTERDPAPEWVAQELESLAPLYFDAGSIPFTASIGADAAEAQMTAQQVAQKIIELEDRIPQLLARATLADVTAEAGANGWEVEWHDDRVFFTRKQWGSSEKIVHTRFDKINIRELRELLDLKYFK